MPMNIFKNSTHYSIIINRNIVIKIILLLKVILAFEIWHLKHLQVEVLSFHKVRKDEQYFLSYIILLNQTRYVSFYFYYYIRA